MEKNIAYQAFIFDLDGTILSTIEDICDSVNYSLLQHHLPTIDTEYCTHCVGDGSVKMVKRAMHQEHLELFPSVFDVYYQHYLKHPFDKTKPFDGLTEALEYAKARGILLFVYTNKPQDIASAVMEKCFRAGLFERMVGVPLGGKTKPDPEAFLTVGKEYQLDYSRCAYFGDSNTDLLTAVNLHIENRYSVLWGYQDKEKILSANVQPKAFLRETKQIKDVVDNLL